MFPPIDEAVLQNNPKFAALHKTLTTRILNPDGSSSNPNAADREARAEAIQAQGVRSAKTEILRSSLKLLPLADQTPPLPPELIELIILLSLTLSTPTPLPPSAQSLLDASEPYASLSTHLPRIGALISSHLHQQALALARVLHPTTNASFQHRNISRVPTTLTALLADISAKKKDQEARRLELVPLVTRVLEAHRAATELVIRILEQHKHGQLARAVRAKAERLAVEARQAELNVKVLNSSALGLVYSPEVNRALKNYMEHLRDGRSRLRQRQKDAEKELERYGVGREGKEKLMKEIARVYGEIAKQIQEVKKDMERLEAG